MDMSLNHQPFLTVKDGTKKVEIRLNDEKRSQLKVGDGIHFTDLETGETVDVKVVKLEYFTSFVALFEKYSGTIIGSPEDETVEELDRENQQIYSRAREKRFGALAITIKIEG